nr:MAG TPA: hypothetical protein [Bacteriophage sp.]
MWKLPHDSKDTPRYGTNPYDTQSPTTMKVYLYLIYYTY